MQCHVDSWNGARLRLTSSLQSTPWKVAVSTTLYDKRFVTKQQLATSTTTHHNNSQQQLPTENTLKMCWTPRLSGDDDTDREEKEPRPQVKSRRDPSLQAWKDHFDNITSKKSNYQGDCKFCGVTVNGALALAKKSRKTWMSNRLRPTVSEQLCMRGTLGWKTTPLTPGRDSLRYVN